MLLLYNVPENHLVVEPVKKFYEGTNQEIPQVAHAYRIDVLKDMLTRKLMQKVGKSKKGYVTIKEAENALHLDRIKNPNGYSTIKVEDIVAEHPLEFKIEGKRILRAR